MAHVAAPSSSPPPPPPPPLPPQSGGPLAPHGTKRSADTGLEHEQRLSKRFDLLNLVDNSGSRLYIPVPGSTDAALPRQPAEPISVPHPLASTMPLKKRDRTARPPRTASDGMDIEDTPHRVYIHDLAAELSDMESDEENPIFLSDIEKHLSKIPKHVLMGPEPKANEHNQMVLYNIPTSLTLPEDKDSVRKAIVDARQRIRNMQANPVAEPARSMREGVGSVPQHTPPPAVVDSEAMDLD